jgi:hypothetical protein
MADRKVPRYPDLEDTRKEIRKISEQDAAAAEQWDKAVRYNSIIQRIKGERDEARSLLKKIEAWDFEPGVTLDDVRTRIGKFLKRD